MQNFRSQVNFNSKRYIAKNNRIDASFISSLIVILLFLSYLFIVSDENVSQGEVYVIHINFNKNYVIALLLVLGLLIATKGSVYFDAITLSLILRFVLFLLFSLLLVVLGWIETDYQNGIMLTYFVCIIAYLWGKEVNKNFIAKILFLSLIVILFQLIVTYIGRELSFQNITNLKWWMWIPIGQTNTIGCYVIGMVTYICSSKIKRIIKYFAYLIALMCIVFTVSRSGILFFGLYTLYIIVKWILRDTKRLAIRMLGVFTCAILILSIYILSDSSLFERFNWDSLTSSRFQVYKEGLELFLKYPLTGVSAYSFKIYDAVKAHNWILESLIESGIFCSIILFYVIYLVIKIVSKRNKEYLPFVAVYLLQGLVEPNLFTIGFDVFFWLLIGKLKTKKGFYEKDIRNNSNLSKN